MSHKDSINSAVVGLNSLAAFGQGHNTTMLAQMSKLVNKMQASGVEDDAWLVVFCNALRDHRDSSKAWNIILAHAKTLA